MKGSLARLGACIATGIALTAGLTGCLLNIHTGKTQIVLASKACVAGVVEVNAGTNGSLYIQDSRGIVHYSRAGAILATFGPTKGDWTVDTSGDVYYLQGTAILKVSPQGTVLHSFVAPMMEPEAINPANGDILAVYGGGGYTGTGPDAFELFSPTGAAIHRWESSFGGNMAFDAEGDIVTIGQTGAELAAVNPKTGKTVDRTPPTLGAPYNDVGSNNRGNIWIGGTNSTDTPFTVEKMTLRAGRFTFKTLNSSEESVGGLTVGSDGSIFVIRSSYNEPGPTDTGLEELSAKGSGEGKFAVCK